MIKPVGFLFAAACCASVSPVLAFQLPSSAIVSANASAVASPLTTMSMSTTTATASTNEDTSKSHLYIPSERDERYQGNIARYLLDLNDEGATFDFCGGMMFQLVLSDKLATHLETVAASQHMKDDQPIMHPASQPLMSRIPNYHKSANANNISIFHGRELRKIPSANGGNGFVLQLSYADPAGVESSDAAAGKGADAGWNGQAVDPQGWSSEEIATYDGWRGDSFRKWRKGPMYESEGFGTFSKEFGNDAFGLNHRFFLHLDDQSRMWLCAEDGCEGTPSAGRSLMGKLGGILFGK
mmetsp:Transcript_2532/g.5392  ORF Transcript_2532/g.5392 Transcript_2532/m.5392 type:complete len:297 (-) Transcript_2532:268-1158(-)|eukprot:CAMPEP_0172298408 /NCGR_PEP_ID=MMETSP1058-20130122/1083_1 /TAXON_ID=83371 /ORGANISM="Detonula confervacea, Strain CCMP 353" /LENGTH=296 /DNA_ID=CAMNT_0013007683 /DNA_START=73 /DNA_END=963 /DNA_ORIENTATION=+